MNEADVVALLLPNGTRSKRGSSPWKTQIGHWEMSGGTNEEPSCYLLWGARLTLKDKLDKMVREVQALTKTYIDGAGLFT